MTFIAEWVIFSTGVDPLAPYRGLRDKCEVLSCLRQRGETFQDVISRFGPEISLSEVQRGDVVYHAADDHACGIVIQAGLMMRAIGLSREGLAIFDSSDVNRGIRVSGDRSRLNEYILAQRDRHEREGYVPWRIPPA